MHVFADGQTASDGQCDLGLVSETTFDLAGLVVDPTCVDTSTSAGTLDLSTNIYFYDNDGNRAWSGVS